LIESNLFDGDFATIEHFFQFRRWYLAERFKEPPVVEPVDPLERRVFHVV
jgi:hypothetical protein